MAIPSQTPAPRRWNAKKTWLRWLILLALFTAFVVGFMVTAAGLARQDGNAPSVVWLGVAMMLASVLILIGRVTVGFATASQGVLALSACADRQAGATGKWYDSCSERRICRATRGSAWRQCGDLSRTRAESTGTANSGEKGHPSCWCRLARGTARRSNR